MRDYLMKVRENMGYLEKAVDDLDSAMKTTSPNKISIALANLEQWASAIAGDITRLKGDARKIANMRKGTLR